MKLFHFYIDSDEQQSVGYYKLVFPFCKNKLGYGIFYWGLDNMGFIKSIDYRGKSILSYFENGANSIKNYDDGMGRWGKNKLQELNDPKYIRAAIEQIFGNEDMLQTMKMWRGK
jgi:hypothetical protein